MLILNKTILLNFYYFVQEHFFKVFFFALFIVLWIKGYVEYADSGTYLGLSEIRTAGYPLFLFFCKLISSQYQLEIVLFLQILLNLVAVYYFVRSLGIIFDLSFLKKIVVYGLLIFPLLKRGYANGILSEALAYPLVLSFFSLVMLGFYKREGKIFIYSSVILYFLFLTRQQYVILYGILLFSFLYAVFQKISINKKYLWLSSIFLSFALAIFSEKSYHYVMHGKFISTPFTGIQIVVLPLYAANHSVINAIKDPLQKSYLEQMSVNMEGIWNENKHKNINEFYDLYNIICHKYSMEAFSRTMQQNNIKSDAEFMNTFLIQTAISLIRENVKNCFSLYIDNVIHSLGRTTKTFLIFFIFVFCGIYVYRFYDLKILLLMISIMGCFANSFAICIVEPGLERYTYVHKIVLGIFLFCVLAEKIGHYIKRKKSVLINWSEKNLIKSWSK